MQPSIVRTLRYIRIALAGLVTLAALAGCEDRDTATLTAACVRASTQDAPDQTALRDRCRCSAVAARKYLDKDDYRMLVGVAEIYETNEPDDVKLHKLIDALVKSGVTEQRAVAAAIDFMFLAHKVSGECVAAKGT